MVSNDVRDLPDASDVRRRRARALGLLLAGLVGLLAHPMSARANPTCLAVSLLSTSGFGFWGDLRAGVQDRARELGFDIREAAVNDASVSTQQAALLERLLTLDCVGMIVAPLGEHSTPVLAEFAESGRPLVLVDRPATDGSGRVAAINAPLISSDQESMGRLLAEQVVRDFSGRDPRVAMLLRGDGVASTLARERAFRDHLKEAGITVEFELTLGGEPGRARRLIRQNLERLLAADAIMASNEGGTMAILLELSDIAEGADRRRPDLYASGINRRIETALETGLIRSTAAQEPYRMGQFAVDSLRRLMFGLSTESWQRVPVSLIIGRGRD